MGKLRNLNVVVTGGLGFIGSHLAELLISQGNKVWIIDDQRTAVLRTIDGAEIIYDELSQAVWPDDIDHIFHLAGPVGPVGVIQHAGQIVHQVMRAADRVVDEALINRCRLTYVSTSEVYGSQVQPVHETSPRVFGSSPSARMEYAVAKLAAETSLLNTHTLDVSIVRPFNVAGPRQSEMGGFVIPRFIRQAKNGEPLTVYTPGSQQRAFTHVKDIVRGIEMVAASQLTKEVWNLGNPKNTCTIMQLARDVRDLLGSSSEINIIDPRDLWGPKFFEAPDKIPDSDKANKYLGWEPVHTRAEVILDAAA